MRLGRWLKISCETRKENKVNDLCDAYFDIVKKIKYSSKKYNKYISRALMFLMILDKENILEFKGEFSSN